jgi:hypothetical protein
MGQVRDKPIGTMEKNMLEITKIISPISRMEEVEHYLQQPKGIR